MTDSDEITRTVIEVVQGAVHKASEDYFVWSRGHALYDCAEFLPQVYAAQKLFKIFHQEVIVRMERPVNELVLPKMGGRVDLTVEFNSGALYVIEFKRYPTDRCTASDVARLRKIGNHKRGRIGLLAAPGYMKGPSNDWLGRYKDQHANDSSQIWHLSAQKQLPDCFRHVEGFTHERVLVIEVCNSAQAGS